MQQTQKLYEFAVIYHPKPTKEDEEIGRIVGSQLVVPPKHVLADSEAQAGILAARAIPEEYLSKLSQVEVAIRPF